MYLNEKDKQYLNEVYARAYKKYFAFSGSVADGMQMLGYNEALEVARDELEAFNTARRAEINAKHEKRVLGINSEAAKRGLVTSTIVLQQNEKAEYDRTVTLAKFESVTDTKVRALARKMMSDNMTVMKLGADADKTSLDMFAKASGIGGFTTVEKQKAMDEEVYSEYMRFLLSKNPEVALSYVDDDPLFYFNLSEAYYTKLVAEMEKRGWRT